MFPKSPNDFRKLSGAQQGEITPVGDIQSSFSRKGHSYSTGMSLIAFSLVLSHLLKTKIGEINLLRD